MASTLEFTEYVAEQLSGAGEITYKKMFGEYGLYCNGKFFGSVEDNQLYIKITKPGEELIPNAVIASPHEGSRYFLIENLEDTDFLAKLIMKTCDALPAPKPKKRKEK